MTTYYRNEENQVFSFQADIDYENQEISGYEIMLETGEEVYKGTLRGLERVSDEKFQQDVDNFVKHMKERMEPFRVLVS